MGRPATLIASISVWSAPLRCGIRRQVSPRLVAVAVPVLLAAAFAVVQFTYLRPPSSQDGMHYFERAAAWPDVPLDHWSLRVGLLLPVRLLQTLLGYSRAAYYALPLAAGGLLVLSTYWLGRLLFVPAVGVAAALLLLFSHAFLNSSSILLPDHTGAALLTAAVALLVFTASRPEAAGWSARRHTLLVLAGLLLGWAYLVREYVVFVFPVVAAVFWCYRLPWRKLAWVAAPAAAVFAGEVVLNLVVHGSPLERLLVSGGHGGRRSSITDTRLDALTRLPRALADAPGGATLLVALVLMAAGLAWTRTRRDRRFLVVAAWFTAFWVPFTLGTGLVDPSFRFVIADKLRYWLPVAPAVVVGGAAVGHAALARLARRARVDDGRPPAAASSAKAASVAVVTVAVAAVLGVVGSAGDRARDVYRVNGATQLGELAEWLASPGARNVRVVWTDPFTARLVPLYARPAFGGERSWRGEVRSFLVDGRWVAPAALDEGAVVLYRFGYRALPGGYSGIPKYIRRPREVQIHHPDKSLVVYTIPDR